MRICWQRNERAAILYLRKKFNYTITALAQFTGRSASLIHRILKFNKIIGNLPFADLRKIPNQLRLRTAQKHRLTLQRFMDLWAGFILGSEDKPP
jgi:hypothetical protein